MYKLWASCELLTGGRVSGKPGAVRGLFKQPPPDLESQHEVRRLRVSILPVSPLQFKLGSRRLCVRCHGWPARGTGRTMGSLEAVGVGRKRETRGGALLMSRYADSDDSLVAYFAPGFRRDSGGRALPPKRSTRNLKTICRG